MLRIGDASYSIYLSHAFLAGIIARFAGRLPGGATGQIAGILFGLAVCSLAGWFVHLYIERPLTQIARRLLGRRLRIRPLPA